jgi:hypothetical protein
LFVFRIDVRFYIHRVHSVMGGKTKPIKPEHTCGECKLGEEIRKHWNMALDGHYICVRCPHSTRARLKSETACEHFKMN